MKFKKKEDFRTFLIGILFKIFDSKTATSFKAFQPANIAVMSIEVYSLDKHLLLQMPIQMNYFYG